MFHVCQFFILYSGLGRVIYCLFYWLSSLFCVFFVRQAAKGTSPNAEAGHCKYTPLVEETRPYCHATADAVCGAVDMTHWNSQNACNGETGCFYSTQQVGAGYIAVSIPTGCPTITSGRLRSDRCCRQVEMAGILHGLGTETHLAFRGDTVLRRASSVDTVERLPSMDYAVSNATGCAACILPCPGLDLSQLTTSPLLPLLGLERAKHCGRDQLRKPHVALVIQVVVVAQEKV